MCGGEGIKEHRVVRTLQVFSLSLIHTHSVSLLQTLSRSLCLCHYIKEDQQLVVRTFHALPLSLSLSVSLSRSSCLIYTSTIHAFPGCAHGPNAGHARTLLGRDHSLTVRVASSYGIVMFNRNRTCPVRSVGRTGTNRGRAAGPQNLRARGRGMMSVCVPRQS